MDPDLILTLGIVLMVVSVPSLLSAWVDGRVPRIGALIFVASSTMIVTAMVSRPSGYRFDEIPGVMLEVASRLVN